MKFITHWLDVRAYLHSGQQPRYLIKREPSQGSVQHRGSMGTYWVPANPLFGDNPGWTVCSSGEMVLVPISGYVTVSHSIAEVFGMGVQIGLAAVASLRSQTPDPVIEAVLALGHECSSLTDLSAELPKQFQCYVGIALRTK